MRSRRLAAVLVVLLVAVSASCVSRATRTIRVGEDWTAANDSLREAGATKTDMAVTGRTESPTGGAYQLRSGRVVIFNCTECADSKVTAIEVCRNADAPKAERKWEKVDQLLIDDQPAPQ
jgi:hypothetical protein